MKEEITINSTAITLMLDNAETQIILQRHCNYDRRAGTLLESSAKITWCILT